MARYRMLEVVGAGAAGAVYLVEDTAAGHARCALKRIEHASDPEFRASFAREFAMLASLSIPGVAPVFDLGTLPAEGELPAGPYFTRAFIPGEPLDSFARSHTFDERMRVFVALAGIVRALHRRGVVHGDIKPANVIVDPHGQPWLIDFGLSARLHDTDAVRGAGTLPFMAPELLRGAAPSASSDVYALAGTLYQVITHALPNARRARHEAAEERVPAEQAALAVAQAGLSSLEAERVCSADELCARLQAALALDIAQIAPQHPVRPRTRGRAALLGELERTLTAARATAYGLLVGKEGAGKSVVLRELKWRLQLAGVRVSFVEGRAFGRDPASQAALQGEGGARDQHTVLLVDDLDASDPAWLAELCAVARDAGQTLQILATARAADAAQGGLPAAVCTELPPLGDEDSAAIVRELLGAIDPAAEERLVALSGGLPGVLVNAAAELAGRSGLTSDDVQALALGGLARRNLDRQLSGLSSAARTLARGLAVAEGPLSQAFVAAWLADRTRTASAELVAAGLACADLAALWPADADSLAALRARETGSALRDAALSMLDVPGHAELGAPVRTRIGVQSGRGDLVAASLPEALDTLKRAAMAPAARALAEASLPLLEGVALRAAQVLLVELYTLTGDNAQAATLAESLLALQALLPEQDARTRIFAARAQIAAGAVGRAEALLADAPAEAPPALLASAACELARIQLRRGAFEAAGSAASSGLLHAQDGDASRCELSAIAATAHARLGRTLEARREFEAAVAFAELHAAPRERALVLGYFALELERGGELEQASTHYLRATQCARDAGDIGQMATYASNLGNVQYQLGEVERSEDSFVLASQLAQRAGRPAMARVAEGNLADVLVYVGAYARARTVIEACAAAAHELPLVLAKTTHVSAELDARTGRVEQALSGYAHTHARYHALGRQREACTAQLDAAECLLDRAGVSDASAASTELSHARAAIEAHALTDFRLRHELLVARTRMQNGDVEGAVRELQGLEPRASQTRDRELRWKVAYALSLGYAQSGASLVAASTARSAAEWIEALAVRLSPDLREGFRRDPRRRAALAQHEALKQAAVGAMGSSAGPDTRLVHGVDARYRRLLEVNKRLARERDVDRVLERITDTAIELAGAERGFVLLVDARGALGAHVVRVHGGHEDDPHVAFSRSIAEAVLIDGEPIVTVNARDDRRLNEYLSVHKLMLKSVACIPINGKERTLGVLYLEHRMRAGRFDEHDLDLLLAFADQAAIALENARLWSEVEAQRSELKSSNDALVTAKSELERVLHARNEELHEVRAHLEKARSDAASAGRRFGIVGRCTAMQRLFALLERVQQSHVPVVVQGESGTGKELVARAIHQGGVRARGPFVTVNCAALPDALIESELFGHVRGAFTGADRDRKGVFAQAHGGTLFLDEFAEASPRVQVGLLRVLQEGRVLPVGADVELPIDVRIVVATQRPLAELVAQGRLREDLFYRLSVVEIRVPSLRDRREDIPELCEHLLLQTARREQREAPRLTRSALEALLAHPLPGNVRQLEHLLVSGTMMSDGAAVDAVHLGLAGEPDATELLRAASVEVPPAASLPSDLGAYKAREKAKILDALDRHAWNRAKAAHELGMPRRTFYRRLSEFGILDEGSESAHDA